VTHTPEKGYIIKDKLRGEMPNYHIWTIGCQMNQAESERLGSLFEHLGYQATDTAENADVVVLNSCVVRQSAENRVVNKIQVLRAFARAHPDITLAVTGCLVNSDSAKLKKDFPHVDYFFKPGDFPPWVEKPEATMALPQKPSPATYVSIIQGCNNFCAYCIVPHRRGREISRTVPEVVCEVRELVKRGSKEVTLLGQNVDSYGHDLPDKPDLADLLKELNTIDGLARIRFLTNHPKDISDKLIDAIAGLDRVCEQVSLPVQSGSDDILKLMKRGYNTTQYRRLVKKIRDAIPGAALSTDIIVGFPSETDFQFQETVRLLSELRFDTVHVAAYSPRPGTTASRELEDDILPAVKKERLSTIEQLQGKIAAEINEHLLGKTVEILVESRVKGKWQGRTRTGKLVFFSDSREYTGQLVKIRIEKTSPWSLQGTISRTK
jgi:tRNA-2-methylthio-N6-dimethylallyladenosine synthase